MKTNIATKALNWCIDTIFPKYCLGCNSENAYLCPNCKDSLPALKSDSCFVCGKRSPAGYACPKCRKKINSPISGIMVAADWDNELLRQIIYAYKYHFVKELSVPLSELMTNCLKRQVFTNKTNPPDTKILLIPVPLHGRRLAWRGFNQAELLTREISKHCDFPSRADILIRARHTLAQQEISDQKNRAENIKNAFALSPKSKMENNLLKNKIVILTDDVCTTGATIKDCARALKPLKPKEIWGLVIARG